MDAELKKKWVEALRSGKYRQGQYCLRTTDGAYCCLGVLCDCLDGSGWVRDGGNYWAYDFTNYGPQRDYGSHRVDLPVTLSWDLPVTLSWEVFRWLPGTQGKLIAMNDQGRPFTEIADYIEQNL